MNKLLLRQIKRKIGHDSSVGDSLKELFQMISESYDHYERDRKLLEKAMEISSEELRNNYTKLVVQNELERKNFELENFVSIASHDLKAPLRTINSFTKLLQIELSKIKLSIEAEEYIDFIINATNGMNTLIMDLLEYSKIGAKNSEKTELDLNQILELVEKNLFALITENKAKIIYKNLPRINAMPHEMLQLFQNLVGNAIKYKKKNVPPVVAIKCELNIDSYIFFVEDNGMGISEKNKHKVFEAFSRLEGGLQYKGSGLGLSICKKIIDNVGGKIWLESKPGIGTKFLFTIPKKKVEIKKLEKSTQSFVSIE